MLGKAKIREVKAQVPLTDVSKGTRPGFLASNCDAYMQ
jgi:hypothetical protein